MGSCKTLHKSLHSEADRYRQGEGDELDDRLHVAALKGRKASLQGCANQAILEIVDLSHLVIGPDQDDFQITKWFSINQVIGPLSWPGQAACLGQDCPQMTQRPVIVHQDLFDDLT